MTQILRETNEMDESSDIDNINNEIKKMLDSNKEKKEEDEKMKKDTNVLQPKIDENKKENSINNEIKNIQDFNEERKKEDEEVNVDTIVRCIKPTSNENNKKDSINNELKKMQDFKYESNNEEKEMKENTNVQPSKPKLIQIERLNSKEKLNIKNINDYKESNKQQISLEDDFFDKQSIEAIDFTEADIKNLFDNPIFQKNLNIAFKKYLEECTFHRTFNEVLTIKPPDLTKEAEDDQKIVAEATPSNEGTVESEKTEGIMVPEKNLKRKRKESVRHTLFKNEFKKNKF
ncbi:putative leucine-rich repeat-containing protein DDB_G0290503 isoform X1 [Leptopilina boulardi]|uniref:putative leucine-rich repeat-containing protein DDB_G0290503 isoform X1 n=1 Tax=Leptopilina boulardi TaxID=63433 RepID=UPI0021F60DED|nr:putative leucine-rich repeat-containing protein DDB_G0290503 isoform X1 [Leptopilina boulardi]